MCVCLFEPLQGTFQLKKPTIERFVNVIVGKTATPLECPTYRKTSKPKTT